MSGVLPSSETLAASRVIAGRYRLERVLGKGGMGVVWQARHIALNTDVAIKFLNHTTASQESMRRRFATEAQVTAQLKTRHAVQVFDFGVTDDGQAFLVMELMDGEPLSAILSHDARIAPKRAVSLLEQAARALDRAHALGIVHRDFKPENIFVTRDEEGNAQVKVMDFGVAKLIGDLEMVSDTEEPPNTRAALSRFTRTGAMLGTPYYMAPEQIANAADVGRAADIWAFGVVAFECVTGCPPFDAQDLNGLFEQITRGAPLVAHEINPRLSPAFDAWFARACAKSPDQRFASAHDACVALAQALLPDDALSLRPPTELSSDGLRALGTATPAAAPSDPFASTVLAHDARATPRPNADSVGDGGPTDPKIASHPWSRSLARPPSRRRPVVAAAGALAVAALLGGLAASRWRSGGPSSASPVALQAVTTPAVAAPPPAAPAPAPAPSELPAVVASESIAPVAPAPSAVPTGKPTAARAASGHVRTAGPAVAAAPATPAEPPAPTPSPRPAASNAPSPFQLPPLGL